MDYTIIRSRRKTLAIHVTREANVEVRAPLRLSKAAIESFVASKRDWIDKHLREMQLQNAKKDAYALGYGCYAILCGKQCPVIDAGVRSPSFDGSRFLLPSGLDIGAIRLALVEVYKKTIREVLLEKVRHYSAIMNVTPTAVRVNSAKTRWGSCSGRNSLNFSWRLALAPQEVIDYVVVHELAHIVEHNHSDKFWTVVAKVMPDYARRRQMLKHVQQRLYEEGWD